MKISIVQYSPVWEDKPANMEKISRICAALPDGTDLVIFPEMTLTGFTMNAKGTAEQINGSSYVFFSGFAKSHNVNVIFGMPLFEDDNYFNGLIVLNREGTIETIYKKIHLFSFAKEDQSYTPGTAPVIANIDGFRIGLSICYDLRFPELYRHYSKAGIDLLIDIANWPTPRIEHWNAFLKARAIENLAFLISVNRTGQDPFTFYNGSSSVISPLGEIIASGNDEDVLINAVVDLNAIKEARAKFPFLNDIKLI